MAHSTVMSKAGSMPSSTRRPIMAKAEANRFSTCALGPPIGPTTA